MPTTGCESPHDPRAALSQAEILAWLREDDPERLAELWRLADRARAAVVGDEVHLRGLVEFGNVCCRQCLYCGLRGGNPKPARYRMTIAEIMSCAAAVREHGYGTIVLQSGEDPGTGAGWLASLIRRLRETHPGLAITLSVGERPPEDYRLWREAGADRYLLRFETGDRELFRRLHPPVPGSPLERGGEHVRIRHLRILRDLGYEVGSGIMAGLPGQSWQSVAEDIETFRDLDLDMVGIGSYIPHPATPLGRTRTRAPRGLWAYGGLTGPRRPDQVPATALSALKVVALTRLVCPEANIPATHAVAGITAEGHAAALCRGANVIMPDLTPPIFRRQYDIYPSPLRMARTPPAEAAVELLARLGRPAGLGPGGRRRHAAA